jgi:uncharacterized protein
MRTAARWAAVAAAVGLVCILGLLLIKELNIYYPVKITQSNSSGEFSITGEGKVDVVPDTAYVDVGIQVLGAADVKSVQDQVNSVNNKIIDRVKGMGIDAADIKTTNYSVFPQAEDRINNGLPGKISGYTGNATITIKVKDKAKAPEVVQAATDSGANTVNGVRYSVENPDQFRAEARKKAIENAKKQAESLSKELGISLGRITNAVENNNNVPGPLYAMDAKTAMGGGAGAPTFEPGTQTISSSMTLYFEKK